MEFTSLIDALPALGEGLQTTLKLMVIAVLGGIALGTVLALCRLSNNRTLSLIANVYVGFFRSIPLLLVISWFYFLVPMIIEWMTGKPEPVGPFISSLVAFTMFEAAYYSEILRAGIQSIPKGQVSAAYALGMNYRQAMRLIILPQAFRKMAPLLLQQSIILFQDTALVYAVGLMDFLNTARSRGDITGELPLFLLSAGAVYFIISFTASRVVIHLQKKLAVAQAH